MQTISWKSVRAFLIPMLITSVALVGCESDEILDPGKSSGTVQITIVPDGLDAGWTLVSPGGDMIEGSGSAKLENMIPGEYAAAFDAVEGYRAPLALRGVLLEDQTLTFTGEYVELGFGTVVIDTEPDEVGGEWALIGADGDVFTGVGDSTLTDVPAGSYNLAWIAAEGWITPTPTPIAFELAVGATESFTGTWENGASGTIEIDVDPDALSAPWNLEGPDGYQRSGAGDETLGGLAVGDYTITWGDVSNHVTPAPETGTLLADQTLSLAATFVLGTGTVTVDQVPDIGARWTLYDGTEVVQTNTVDLSFEVPAGEYTLSWGDKDGWFAPDPRDVDVSVEMGGIEVVSGTYTEDPGLSEPETGNIAVRVDPNSATWSISGPQGFEQAGSYTGDEDFTGVVVGDYTVSWNTPSGYLEPGSSSSSFELLPDANETVSQTFQLIPTSGPVISGVEGTFSHGSTIVINGSDFGVKEQAEPFKWDDFEAGSDEAYLMDVQPEWIPYKHKGAKYTTNNPHSGNLAVYNDPAATDAWREFDTNYFQYPHSSRIYVSYWWRTGNATLGDDRGVIKLSRITSSPAAGGDGVYTATGPGYFGFESNPLYGAYMGVQGLGTTRDYNFLYFNINEWVRIEVEIEQSDPGVANGRIKASTIGFDTYESGPWETVVEGEDWKWDTFLLGLMAANLHGTDFQLYIDDVYIDDSFARIELGNRPTFEACTRREIQNPLAWSGNRLEIEANLGAFSPGSELYLFVIDPQGNASPGHSVVTVP